MLWKRVIRRYKNVLSGRAPCRQSFPIRPPDPPLVEFMLPLVRRQRLTRLACKPRQDFWRRGDEVVDGHFPPYAFFQAVETEPTNASVAARRLPPQVLVHGVVMPDAVE